MSNSAETEGTPHEQIKPILELPEWLTQDILIETIRKDVKNLEKITKFEVLPAVSTGENYMTNVLRLFIEIEQNDASIKKLSYMIKILPSSEQRHDMVKNWKVFDKEKNIYNNYIPEFEEMYNNAGKSIRFGPTLLDISSTKVPSDVLIMEDLCRSGFENVKRQNGLDMAHTKCVLEKLAQFHAASACRYEAKGPYPDMYLQCLCTEHDDFAAYREGISTQLRDCLHLYNNATYLDEKLQIYQTQAPDQFQAISPVSSKEFNVLNHGDAWSNNFMFKHDEAGAIVETLFVDLQMSRYGSPAQDIQYLILSSTCLENKLKYFDYFVQFYHEKLIENLTLLRYSKPLPQLKDLHISLYRHGDWAYTIITCLLPIVLLEPSDKANMDNMMAENGEGDDIKKSMFTNERYVEHMQQLLPWMNARGLLEYTKY